MIQNIIEWFRQRRVWSAFISGVVAVLGALGHVDMAVMVASMAASAGLSIWSYARPKN